jgi:hypothetical protein
MKEEHVRLVHLAAAAAASVLLSQAAMAQSDTDSPSGEAASDRAAVEWTPDMMRAAIEVEKPNVDPDKVRAAAGDRAEVPMPPGMTEPSLTVEVPKAQDRDSGDVNAMPLIFAGKMFFSKPNGKNYVCSAQFISKRVLLTAAHCVRDDESGAFWQNIAFALQYDKGRYSQVYRSECAATLNGWVQPGDEKYPYDFAMIRVDADAKNGWFGTAWGWNDFNEATKIGYPGGILEGQVIQVDRGPIKVENGIVELRHGNKADQGGSSGGAWIGDYSSDKGSSNHIISIESFGYDNMPGVDYGPYFDGRLKILWDFVENGCKQ